MANLTWQSVTKALYQAILIQVIGGILAAVFTTFDALGSAGDLAEAAISGDATALFAPSAMGILAWICELAVVAATVWFFISLGNWKKVADANDVPAIQKLWLAALIGFIGGIIAWIPVIGILGSILALVALILNLLGYSALKNSTTLPEGAREGAKKLFTALILNIAGTIIAWIPLIGFIGGIVCIVAFIFMLNGWKRIANS